MQTGSLSGITQFASHEVSQRAGADAAQWPASARRTAPAECDDLLWRNTCRYLPAADDKVIGVVLERFGESFNVDVGGPFVATLSALAFEGARAWWMPLALQSSEHAGSANGSAERAWHSHCA